jgi:hypothetical protein
VKVGERFSTQQTLGGAIAAALCAAGSEHVFAADLTENRPLLCPAYNLDSEDRRSGIHPLNLAVG